MHTHVHTHAQEPSHPVCRTCRAPDGPAQMPPRSRHWTVSPRLPHGLLATFPPSHVCVSGVRSPTRTPRVPPGPVATARGRGGAVRPTPIFRLARGEIFRNDWNQVGSGDVFSPREVDHRLCQVAERNSGRTGSFHESECEGCAWCCDPTFPSLLPLLPPLTPPPLLPGEGSAVGQEGVCSPRGRGRGRGGDVPGVLEALKPATLPVQRQQQSSSYPRPAPQRRPHGVPEDWPLEGLMGADSYIPHLPPVTGGGLTGTKPRSPGPLLPPKPLVPSSAA